jgi:hypothetical protein
VARSADQALHVALHEELQHGLRHAAQEVAVPGLLQQLGEWQPVVGHRSSAWVGASQLHPSRPGRWPPQEPTEFTPSARTLPARFAPFASKPPSGIVPKPVKRP